MTSEQKSNEAPAAPLYHVGHWLLTTAAAAAAAYGVAAAAQAGYVNLRSDDGLGYVFMPFVVGVVMAAGNRRVLSPWAFLALPILLALYLALSFAGVLVAVGLEMKRAEDTLLLTRVLIENLPFFLSGLFLYRAYASMAGRGSWLSLLFVLAWSTLLSVVVFRELIKDISLMFAVFWAGLAMWLSMMHWQQPLRGTNAEKPA